MMTILKKVSIKKLSGNIRMRIEDCWNKKLPWGKNSLWKVKKLDEKLVKSNANKRVVAVDIANAMTTDDFRFFKNSGPDKRKRLTIEKIISAVTTAKTLLELLINPLTSDKWLDSAAVKMDWFSGVFPL